MRNRLSEAVKAAMKSGDKPRLATLRLVMAAIKDRELGIGGAAPVSGPISDADVVAILQKMIKQRRDSLSIYEQAGRKDLAAQEGSEIAVIEEYMPKQMTEAEMQTAVAAVIAETGAAGPQDMGKVMGALKARHAGRMDFAKASGVVKQLLK